MIEQLKCKSCGAALVQDVANHYHCEYCGAAYRTNGVSHIIEVCRAPVYTMCAETHVPHDIRDCISEENISQYAISRLTQQLAEGLASCLKLTVKESPTLNAIVIRGEVRVVPPDFRF